MKYMYIYIYIYITTVLINRKIQYVYVKSAWLTVILVVVCHICSVVSVARNRFFCLIPN